MARVTMHKLSNAFFAGGTNGSYPSERNRKTSFAFCLRRASYFHSSSLIAFGGDVVNSDHAGERSFRSVLPGGNGPVGKDLQEGERVKSNETCRRHTLRQDVP